MKVFRFFILLVIIISASSCDIPLLDGADSTLNPPHDILSPPEGLGEYHVADISAVIREGEMVSLPDELLEMDETSFIQSIIPTFTDKLRENYFLSILEEMGIDSDDLFSTPDIYPSQRAVSTSHRLHIENEGVDIYKGYEKALSAQIEHLDITLDADSSEFLRFLFNLIDGSKWNYSPSTASSSGELGLSGMLSLESDKYEEAVLSLFFLFDFYDIQIGHFDFEFSGDSMTLYFPDEGTLKVGGQVSYATNTISYSYETGSSVGGLINPDDRVKVNGKTYCPMLSTLVIRDSAYFDASILYDAIRKMATSSSFSGEAIWNTLKGYIWPDAEGPYITLAITIPDNGLGSSINFSLSDWSLIQVLFSLTG